MRLPLTVLALAVLASCQSNSWVSGPNTQAEDSGPDQTLAELDGGTADAAAPDGQTPDGPIPLTYNAMTDLTRWTNHDIAGMTPSAKGYFGVGFDGRYAYFVPHNGADGPHGLIARYDTRADFALASSWTTFDLTTANSKAKGYAGSAFDGHYLYLAPPSPSSGTAGAPVARYDTRATFASASSWSWFDTTSVRSSAAGFYSAVFDKRYVYFVPFRKGTTYHGLVARYDTKADFTAAASWSTFNLASLNASALGYSGGVFDGRYLYLVPLYNGSYHGLAVRYDTTAAFDSASSWQIFNMTKARAGAQGYGGGGFDGRYVYYVPSGAGGLVARYDTTVAFNSTSSWAFFNLTGMNSKASVYFGAGFDGRYFYFIPHGLTSTGLHGLLARYDTQGAFDLTASWTIYDLATLNSSAVGFYGAAFDGRFLYLGPSADGSSGVVFRFDAKSPPSMPSCYNGSFF